MPGSRFPFSTLELESAAKILARAESFGTSVRNSFYGYTRKESLKPSSKEFKTIYHLTLETVRRQNVLDELLHRTGIQFENIDVFPRNLFRIAMYIIHEQEYKTREKPTSTDIAMIFKEIADLSKETWIPILKIDNSYLSFC